MKESDLCKQFYRIIMQMQNYGLIKQKFILLHVANEHLGNPKYTRHLMQMGLLPGAPDYLILHKDGWAALEFKRDKRSRQTESQKRFQEQAESLGVLYCLTFDVDKAVEFVTNLFKEEECKNSN